MEPDELGAVVHGPVVLARSPGIVARLALDDIGPGTFSEPRVLVQVGDAVGPADASQATSRGGNEGVDLDANLWIDELPTDGRVVVTVSWRQAGLAESRTELQLRPWTDADVLPLL